MPPVSYEGNKQTIIDCGRNGIVQDFDGSDSGGDEGDRTPGLGVANAALSQLSYIPNRKKTSRAYIFIASMSRIS